MRKAHGATVVTALLLAFASSSPGLAAQPSPTSAAQLTPFLAAGPEAVSTPRPAAASVPPSPQPSKQELVLRAWGVPNVAASSVNDLAKLRILEAFQKRFPSIRPVSSGGLEIQGGSRTMDFVPLMQIAGDIPPHVIYVNFRQSETYIRNKFLYPLDKYVERSALGIDVPDSHLLATPEYVRKLQASPRYQAEIAERFPARCWDIIRRECPYGEDCPYVHEWGAKPARHHDHIWCWTQGPGMMGLLYRRDLFREAGLPDRGPETFDEFLTFARKLTNPREDRFGLDIGTEGYSWSTLSFLYSAGGRLVDQDANGEWRCAFDGNEAVEAYYFVARMLLEPFDVGNGRFTTVTYPGSTVSGGEAKIGMSFAWFDTRFFDEKDPAQYQLAPVPKGPTGLRGTEFNSMMTGVYAGLADDVPLRDAAWEYVRYYDGPEARKIRTTTFVENGLGRYIQPRLLKEAGYEEYIAQVPKAWIDAYEQTLRDGVPEPYGKNCMMVYRYASQAIEQIKVDDAVKEAIEANDAPRAKARIQEILVERVRRSNEKMMNILTPQQRQTRGWVATAVAVLILLIFAFVFHRVFKTFRSASLLLADGRRRGWQFGRYKWAYILLLPAAASIAIWAYWPLIRGTVIAFEDYNVRGFSQWVGMENFANVLYDDQFWYALWVSLKYALLYAVFGFTAPIVLAFLLTEVPRGKVIFRTIYYLPAVLSGVIVIFLWKDFYSQYGLINEVINAFRSAWESVANFFIYLFHWGNPSAPYLHLEEVHEAWLDNPNMALFFVLLPVIWAGMGPGCLIYLAALKTVPEEIYESADIDGAGILAKVRHVSLPSIRALVLINFIGAMIGAVRGGSEFVLAMTGGAPYAPYGETEVVGLHIYWQAYGYLRFGAACSMAWVLGSMLVGFTVLRLQQLSRMEFKTARGTE